MTCKVPHVLQVLTGSPRPQYTKDSDTDFNVIWELHVGQTPPEFPRQVI